VTKFLCMDMYSFLSHNRYKIILLFILSVIAE